MTELQADTLIHLLFTLGHLAWLVLCGLWFYIGFSIWTHVANKLFPN